MRKSKEAETAFTDAADVELMEAQESLPDTITISLSDAEQVYSLFQNVEIADAHFHTCQAQNFRQHVQSTYMAGKVDAAFKRIKAAIDAAKGE